MCESAGSVSGIIFFSGQYVGDCQSPFSTFLSPSKWATQARCEITGAGLMGRFCGHNYCLLIIFTKFVMLMYFCVEAEPKNKWDAAPVWMKHEGEGLFSHSISALNNWTGWKSLLQSQVSLNEIWPRKRSWSAPCYLPPGWNSNAK